MIIDRVLQLLHIGRPSRLVYEHLDRLLSGQVDRALTTIKSAKEMLNSI